jgi:HAD superfamily hydrolase (TIGR01509 family)
MTLPHTVVFDLGKVLLDFDYTIAATRIASHGQLNLQAITQFINQSALLLRYETGLLTSEQFYREVCARTGFRADFAEFGRIFADIFSPIPPMIALHAGLRKRGVPCYIFSNTNDLAIQHIRQHYPFFLDFDGYIFSYEHGALKPEAKLYEVVERQAGRKGAELLYLDDRQENIVAGAARGWQVILHQSPEQTLAQVRELGL